MGEVEQQVRFLEFGANMLIHSADIVLTAKHLKQDLAEIRNAVGETRPNGQGEVDAI